MTALFAVDEVEKTAVISPDGLYRYRLSRQWGDGPPMRFVMLNPSTADAEVDDPTIRRCMGFARREGYPGIEVVNLFALRVTRPVHLFDRSIADDPVGPDNRGWVATMLDRSKASGAAIVVAWGAHPKIHWSDVYRDFFDWEDMVYPCLCLGKTAEGHPRHPLYLRNDAPLEVWP